jgi:secretion/DNA translocation related CpaE-like protein
VPAPTLLVTDDPALAEVVRALVVASGRPLSHVAGPPARSAWAEAAEVLVDAASVPLVLEAGLPRRVRLVVVTLAGDDVVPWRKVVRLGADGVLRLPDDEAALLARLTEPAAPVVGGAPVVGVVAGSGGAGASVLAAALAVAAARARHDVLLVDLDEDSSGADILLAGEDQPGARWPDLAAAGRGLAPDTLRAALPAPYDVHVLAVARDREARVTPESLDAVLTAARATYDLVVVDVPGHRSAVPLAARCDRLLLVATGDVRGAATAAARARRLVDAAPLEVVVRALPGAGLDGEGLCAFLGLPAAAELAHDTRLLQALDRGEAPGGPRTPLGRVCDRLVPLLVAA